MRAVRGRAGQAMHHIWGRRALFVYALFTTPPPRPQPLVRTVLRKAPQPLAFSELRPARGSDADARDANIKEHPSHHIL